MAIKNKIFINSDTFIKAAELQDKLDDSYINAADSIKASVFKPETKPLAAAAAVACHKLAFTGGGVHEPTPGDAIVGDVGGATGVIVQVEVSTGTWAAGTAAGDLHIKTQIGTFEAENLDGPQVAISSFEDAGEGDVQANCDSPHDLAVGDSTEITDGSVGSYDGIQTVVAVISTTAFTFTDEWVLTETANCHIDDFASITADSTKDQRTQIESTGHGQLDDDFIRIVSTDSFDGQYDIESVPDVDHIIIDKAYVAEVFDGDEKFYVGLPNGKDLVFSPDGEETGGYNGNLPNNIGGLFEDTKHPVFITVVYGSLDLVFKLMWPAIFHPGK